MCISTRRPFAGRPPVQQPVSLELLQALHNAKLNSNSNSNNGGLMQPQQQQQQLYRQEAVAKKHTPIIVQHNYHDHANDASSLYAAEHPVRGGVTTPFPLKLHEMLEKMEQLSLEHIVSWQPHGRCFVVRKPKEFVELLPSYFKLSKLASFQRQLNLYGFQRITKGYDKGGYYHELFLRNRDFMAHAIQRIKVKGTGVRAKSNPEQEPDFWSMPWVGAASTASAATSNACVNQATVAPTYAVNNSNNNNNMTALFNTQVPLKTERATAPVSSSDEDDDVVCAFGNRTFHVLPTVQQPTAMVSTTSLLQPVDTNTSTSNNNIANDMDNFFHDFDFSEDFTTTNIPNLEDDAVFGDVLESIIS